jgi:hypothetical protein
LLTKICVKTELPAKHFSMGLEGSSAILISPVYLLTYLGRMILRLKNGAGVYSKISVISSPIFTISGVKPAGSMISARVEL